MRSFFLSLGVGIWFGDQVFSGVLFASPLDSVGRVAYLPRSFLNSPYRGCPVPSRLLRRVGFHTVGRAQFQSREAGRLVVARHGPEASFCELKGKCRGSKETIPSLRRRPGVPDTRDFRVMGWRSARSVAKRQ